MSKSTQEQGNWRKQTLPRVLQCIVHLIDREFVTSAKIKFATFNEFSKIKKFLKIRTKIC